MAFIRASGKDVPKEEACIDGRFVYTINHKHSKSGHTKQGHIGNRRRLAGRFCVKSPQGEIGEETPPPESTVGGLGVSLSVVSYRTWSCRVAGVSGAFLKSKPLVRNIYAETPLFPEINPDAMCDLLKPLYGLATACRGRYGALISSLHV